MESLSNQDSKPKFSLEVKVILIFEKKKILQRSTLGSLLQREIVKRK